MRLYGQYAMYVYKGEYEEKGGYEVNRIDAIGKEFLPDVSITDGDMSLLTMEEGAHRDLHVDTCTGCGQKVDGMAASAVWQSYHNRNGGLWVLYKSDRIMANAFVWAVSHGDRTMVVFDSIEGVEKTSKTGKLFVEAARYLVGKNGITSVWVGKARGCGLRELTGSEKEIRKFDGPTGICTCDSEKIRLLAGNKDDNRP